MKKLIVVVLCLILSCTTALASPLGSDYAELNSTRDFLLWLEYVGAGYDYYGLDDEGLDECVSFVFNNCNLTYYFETTETFASMYCWGIIEYAPGQYEEVVDLCNRLNRDYCYVTFYCDPRDNTVTAYMDMIYRDHDVGAIMAEATEQMTAVILLGMEELSAYDL